MTLEAVPRAADWPLPKGSARLRHAPPSLEPKGRETRRDEKAEAARPKVEELFNTEGARSPSMRDQVRRRLGVGLYETAQALFVYSKMSALYSLFKTMQTHCIPMPMMRQLPHQPRKVFDVRSLFS